MGKSPAFQMYAADFDMDTGSWTNPQVGVYVRLLLYSWVNGSIPNNMAELARIARTDTRTLAKMWKGTLAKKWKLLPENMYVNPRLEIEREKQSKYIESQKQKGIKRSEKMWEGHIAVAKKRLQPKDSSSSSTSSSIIKNKRKTFIIPSIDEVRAYCLERKNIINPQIFVDHYTGNGWRVGPNPMKDWKAVVRTWETRGGNGDGQGIRTSRSDPRDKNLQSREDAEIAAITARREAAKEAARNKATRAAGNDDAPDFEGDGL